MKLGEGELESKIKIRKTRQQEERFKFRDLSRKTYLKTRLSNSISIFNASLKEVFN